MLTMTMGLSDLCRLCQLQGCILGQHNGPDALLFSPNERLGSFETKVIIFSARSAIGK